MRPTRLCTIDDVKNNGNIEVTYDYDNEGILLAIRSSTTAIQTAIRRDWDFGKYKERKPIPRSIVRGTFRFWVDVRPLQFDPQVPVISVFRTLTSPAHVLEPRYYTVDFLTGRIDIDPGALSTFQGGFVGVDYYGGMRPTVDDPDVYDAPSDLRYACAVQSAFMYDRKVNSKLGVRQYAGKTGLYTYAGLVRGMVPEAYAMVSQYIRPLTGG